MKDITDKLGGNFFVAAFVPTLGFVALGMVVFGPILPPGVATRLQSPFLGQEWLTLIALTVIIGFTLSSLNTFIYKIFEGYMLLERVPRLRRRMQNQASKLQGEIKSSSDKLTKVEGDGSGDEQVHSIRDDLYYRIAEYQQKFPRTTEAILPTAFGNILRAAEDYPAERYGIDAVALWPRLVYVMPESYFNKVDESNNGLGFLINCCLLCLIMAAISIFACCYELILRGFALPGVTKPDQILPGPAYFIPITEAQFVYEQRAEGYLILVVVMIILAYLFYRATLPIARQYGDMIRSAYDLFRFELLKQLNLPLPQDSEAERERWRQISEFVAVGEWLGPLNLQYRFPANAKEMVQESEEVDSDSDLRRYKARKASRSLSSRAKRSKR